MRACNNVIKLDLCSIDVKLFQFYHTVFTQTAVNFVDYNYNFIGKYLFHTMFYCSLANVLNSVNNFNIIIVFQLKTVFCTHSFPYKLNKNNVFNFLFKT